MPKAIDNTNVSFHFMQNGFVLSKRTGLKLFLKTIFVLEKRNLSALQYVFCSDDYLLEINQKHLAHDFYTDIITFTLSDSRKPINAEIYISIDRVKENAFQYKTSFKHELHRVIFHGALHLCGYKDKKSADQKIMRKMEDKYLSLYLNF
jgi:probable rRNA maturation factor